MTAGIPFVKDSFESRYQRPVGVIFEAAKEVLAHNGTLTGENTISNSLRSEEHTSELQSLMRTSYAVFCLKKKNTQITNIYHIKTRNQELETKDHIQR